MQQRYSSNGEECLLWTALDFTCWSKGAGGRKHGAGSQPHVERYYLPDGGDALIGAGRPHPVHLQAQGKDSQIYRQPEAHMHIQPHIRHTLEKSPLLRSDIPPAA